MKKPKIQLFHLENIKNRIIASRSILLWVAVWLGVSGYVTYFSKVAVRQLLAPYSITDQLHNAGSDYLSFKAAVYITTHITTNPFVYNALFTLPSVIAAALLLTLIRQKYSLRLGVATSALLITNASVLIAAKTLDFSILSIALVPYILLLVSWLHPRYSTVVFMSFGVMGAILLSVPYAWVVYIVSFILARKRFIDLVKKISKLKRGMLFVPVVFSFLIHIVYSIKTKSIEWTIGDYKNIDLSLISFEKYLRQLFVDFDATTTHQFPLLLSGLMIVAALSVYVYYQGFHTIQSKVLLASFIVASVLHIAGLTQGLLLAVSVILIMVANGLAFMLHQWFTIFPKNPIARATGVTIIFSFVIWNCVLQLLAYTDIVQL